MRHTAILIDRRPVYLDGAHPSLSVLSLPIGVKTVLETLVSELGRHVGDGILVLPCFQPTDGYRERIVQSASSDMRIITADELASDWRSAEAGDYAVVVEACHWPAAGHDFGDMIRQTAAYRGATHVIAVGADADGTRERVECDPTGNVRRVQRLYNSMTWPDVVNQAISYSIVPARAMCDVTFSSLGELRDILVTHRILSKDVPVASDIDNLLQADGLLAANQRELHALCRRPHANGLTQRPNGVLQGRGCHIDPTARLIGPIIVRDDVQIGAGATILGPTLIGAGARIGDGAVVAQGVITSDAVVPAGTAVRRQVVADSLAVDAVPVPPHIDAVRSGPTPQRDTREPLDASSAIRSDDQQRRIFHRAAKRVFDIAVASLALIALAPLLLVLAIIIKLDSRGPVFFTHRREGKGGKEFDCVKFRTMCKDAHHKQRQLYNVNEVDGPQFKLEHDPRVTRAGRWLRATNLDEMPQLFNVLLGHMSLVGPRPSPFRENQICVPWRRARLSVRPGITGLWQVCRSEDRTAGDFHEWIFYDIIYVRHVSVWLDLKILASTAITVGGKWSVPLAWLLPFGTRPRWSTSTEMAMT